MTYHPYLTFCVLMKFQGVVPDDIIIIIIIIIVVVAVVVVISIITFILYKEIDFSKPYLQY